MQGTADQRRECVWACVPLESCFECELATGHEQEIYVGFFAAGVTRARRAPAPPGTAGRRLEFIISEIYDGIATGERQGSNETYINGQPG